MNQPAPLHSSLLDRQPLVSDEQMRQFREDGYFILDRVIPPAQLAGLRAACDDAVAARDAVMTAQGIEVDGITHKGRRYFLPHNFRTSEACKQWLFGDLLAEVTAKCLGPDVQLFLDQFVVKGAEGGMQFAWHQDGGYVGYPHRPYLSCWVALDDMTAANGTISVLPYARAGGTAIRAHVQESGTNDKVGYHGTDPGELVAIAAGSVVVFSSQTFHKSGANQTNALRRAYLCQYTAEPMFKPDGTLQICAEPFIVGGKRVSG